MLMILGQLVELVSLHYVGISFSICNKLMA